MCSCQNNNNCNCEVTTQISPINCNGVKLPNLPFLTNISLNDLLYIYDISSNTSKKITIQNIFSLLNPLITNPTLNVTDSSTINFTTTGVANHDLSANVIVSNLISTDLTNQLSLGLDGNLFIAPFIIPTNIPLTVIDSNTINFTVNGIDNHTLTGNIILNNLISTDINNGIILGTDGNLFMEEISFQNGLTKTGNNAELGGSLLQNTTLLGDNFNFDIQDLNLFKIDSKKITLKNDLNFSKVEIGKNNTFGAYGISSFSGQQIIIGEDNIIRDGKGLIVGENSKIDIGNGYIFGENVILDNISEGFIYGKNSSIKDGCGGIIFGNDIKFTGSPSLNRLGIGFGANIDIAMGLFDTTGHIIFNPNKNIPINNSDLNNEDFNFIIRSNYFKIILDNNPLYTYAALDNVGAGWVYSSSIEYKMDIEKIDYNKLLECFDNVEINKWKYEKNKEDDYYHTGIISEDFHKYFSEFVKLNDTKTIPTGDIDGINMALIKGLYNRIKILEQKIN